MKRVRLLNPLRIRDAVRGSAGPRAAAARRRSVSSESRTLRADRADGAGLPEDRGARRRLRRLSTLCADPVPVRLDVPQPPSCGSRSSTRLSPSAFEAECRSPAVERLSCEPKHFRTTLRSQVASVQGRGRRLRRPGVAVPRSACAPAARSGRARGSRPCRRTDTALGSSPSPTGPPAGAKNSTRIRGRFGKRTMSTVPVTVTETSCASGTSSARRPVPLRARRTLPREIVPSGKTPMQPPPRSVSIGGLEGLRVALAALDRHLAHRVEDRRQARELPERGLRERTDLPPLPPRPCRSRPGPSRSRGCRRAASGRRWAGARRRRPRVAPTTGSPGRGRPSRPGRCARSARARPPPLD